MAKARTVEKIKSEIDKELSNQSFGFATKASGKIVTQKELQQILGSSGAEIIELIEQGCPLLPDPRLIGRFLFNTGEVLEFISKRDLKNAMEMQQLPELNNAMEAEEAHRRLAVAKAAREELALANERKLVANIEQMVSVFDNVASNVAGNLRSWAVRLPGKLAHKDEKFIASMLDGELEEILKILSELSVDS